MNLKENDSCQICVAKLVRLVEIPHMIYRTYPKMTDWYLSLLKKEAEELGEECLTEKTRKELAVWDKEIRRVVKRGRNPYEGTEAFLSVLKSEAVKDVADVCRRRVGE